jgi:hypothetical protein
MHVEKGRESTSVLPRLRLNTSMVEAFTLHHSRLHLDTGCCATFDIQLLSHLVTLPSCLLSTRHLPSPSYVVRHPSCRLVRMRLQASVAGQLRYFPRLSLESYSNLFSQKVQIFLTRAKTLLCRRQLAR